jgi:PIN domain nuclease of toxin-antitoxin system
VIADRLSASCPAASHDGRVDNLVWSGHHRDPFDRMLVCQAMAERLTIVTRDPDIPRYRVRTLKA